MLEAHVLAWDHLWRRFEIETEADDETRTILDLHVFHLLQTASKHTIDLDVGVPARGLARRGLPRAHLLGRAVHLPVPHAAHARHHQGAAAVPVPAPPARRSWRRQAAGYEGAMFPWQSGSNGREETQVVHLNPKSGNWHPDNSHRQRHINIAVAFNVWKYYQATDDVEFMAFQGAEMMIQIARFWASIATFDKARNRYEIRGVMGPDEYHDGYPDADPPAARQQRLHERDGRVAADQGARCPRPGSRVPAPRAVGEARDAPRGARAVGGDLQSHVRPVPRRRHHQPVRGLRASSRSSTGTATPSEYGNIQRLDRILEAEGVTRRTTTRCPSRPTC